MLMIEDDNLNINDILDLNLKAEQSDKINSPLNAENRASSSITIKKDNNKQIQKTKSVS